MAQIVVRNIEDETMQGLKDLAVRRGMSTEQAVRSLIGDAVEADRRLLAFAASARAAGESVAHTYGAFTDSTTDIRSDRDR